MAKELVGKPTESRKQETDVGQPGTAAAQMCKEAAPAAQAARDLTWRWQGWLTDDFGYLADSQDCRLEVYRVWEV